jgi:cell division septation protein DedD
MSTDTARPGELRADDHYTTALYRAAIGPVGGAYYLPLFTQWELEHKLPLRWNWAAAFSTLGWLIFRKMGLQAIAYVAAVISSVLLVFGIGPLLLDFNTPAVLGWALSLALISVAVPGLWANHWFHAACSKRMTAALKAHSDVAQACEALSQQASPRQRAWAIAGTHALVVLLAGLIAAQFAVWSEKVAPRTVAQDVPATLSTPQTASGRVSEVATVASAIPLVVAPAASASADTTAPLPQSPASVPSKVPTPTQAAAKLESSSAPMALAPAKVAPAPQAPQQSASVPVTTPKASPPPIQAPVAAVRPAATKQPGAFGVNVGLFAVAANAQAAKSKMEIAQLPVIQDTLEMQRGTRIRLRAGPFESKDKAVEAAERIRALGLEAVVYGP